jgi:hypothetical protein
MAVLSFGQQHFRLFEVIDINCIRLDVEGAFPLAVFQRLLDQLNTVMNECMQCLYFEPILTVSGLDDRYCFLTNPVRKASNGAVGRIHSPRSLTKSPHAVWLARSYPLLPYYDIFISYRWGKFDSKLVSLLFDRR